MASGASLLRALRRSEQDGNGGLATELPACEGQHFPRTDPVVIMLITRGNSVLMGRSGFWPEGMYSLLAGFMEPGETIEAAVRREVGEEAGIEVGEVRYLASQPCLSVILDDRLPWNRADRFHQHPG